MKKLTKCAEDVLKVIKGFKGEPVGLRFIQNSTFYTLDDVYHAICQLKEASVIETAEGYVNYYKEKKNEPEKV